VLAGILNYLVNSKILHEVRHYCGHWHATHRLILFPN